MNPIKSYIERRSGEFEKKFDDITHFGCPSTPEVPCGTLRYDIKTFNQESLTGLLLEIVGEVEKMSARPYDPKKTEYNNGQTDLVLELLALLQTKEE